MKHYGPNTFVRYGPVTSSHRYANIFFLDYNKKPNYTNQTKMSNFTKPTVQLSTVGDSCTTHQQCGWPTYYCAAHTGGNECANANDCDYNKDSIDNTCPPFDPCACNKPCGSESKYNGKNWCYINGWKSNPGDNDGGCELAGVEEGTDGDWKYC